jgi:Tfp pilus assembly protein PilV
MAEVLVAVSVFGISALGLQSLYLGMMRTTHMNWHYATATELAQAELEDLRSLAYDDIDTRSRSAVVEGRQFTVNSVVSEGTPQPEMKHVATTVSWTSPAGTTEQFVLETIYAEIGS